MAGSLALGVMFLRPTRSAFAVHAFGFAVAAGTRLYFVMMKDPLMAAAGEFPLALIPLYGVGISGASHLVAFDLLARKRRM